MKKFVIICSQRTGSNMLTSTLQSHPDIECHGELFRRKKERLGRGVRIFAEIDPRFRQEAYLTEHWRELLDLVLQQARESGVQAVGFKLMTQQSEVVRNVLIEDDSWAKILLKRDNVLAVYSSDKIAKSRAKGSFLKFAGAKKPRIKFVADEFDRFHLNYEKRFEDVRRHLDECGQDYLDIRYSDICKPEGIKSVIRFLGLDPEANWEVISQKRNSSQLLERFSNPTEVARSMEQAGLQDWLVE